MEIRSSERHRLARRLARASWLQFQVGICTDMHHWRNRCWTAFNGEPSSLTVPAVSAGQEQGAASASKPSQDLNSLISGASQDVAEYERLTAQGKLAQAGQKLEDLKRKLDQLKALQK